MNYKVQGKFTYTFWENYVKDMKLETGLFCPKFGILALLYQC